MPQDVFARALTGRGAHLSGQILLAIVATTFPWCQCCLELTYVLQEPALLAVLAAFVSAHLIFQLGPVLPIVANLREARRRKSR